ncbi:SpdD-like protein [Streptomyces sp. AMCC400023]|uniref:SpdD-like protein n=1 Tax=Streptomyces sp. AMCC400023 TaxID=2056258 RepID=UPI001F439511|nr:SpdD-like protein [Streptomyces sp. AMCC400023]UJV43441.1 SpdD-like protein [Streptomyces sp. AMCC400023]
MFRPKIPTMPQPTGLTTPPAVIEPTTITPGIPIPSSASVVPAASRPLVQLTPGTTLALVGAGTAVVLVLGAVLVSLLLAVAITGASVAVCAVVLRSLLASDAKRR